MTIWKNGRKPPFMDSEEIDLNAEKIYFAVKQMTLEGLQDMTIYGLLILAKFKSPAEICRAIEDLKPEGEGKSPWLKNFKTDQSDKGESVF
ncbi:MAG: hypothetical protein IJ558_04715 [Treponema sp.]|nr:hypothetical protein [Treponema sp.]